MYFCSANQIVTVSLDHKKVLVLTSAKPQAATQAKYAFVPPAP